AQPLHGALPSLADALAAIAEVTAGLVDELALHPQVEALAVALDALPGGGIELGILGGRCDLVLHHLHTGARADGLVAGLDEAPTAELDAQRRVELQRVATGRGLRVAEVEPDLHADLVDEDDAGPLLGHRAGELTQCP